MFFTILEESANMKLVTIINGGIKMIRKLDMEKENKIALLEEKINKLENENKRLKIILNNFFDIIKK
ncbi:hypothetical protein FDG04_15700 [Clostridium sporogenes]|nr:hypothetical protein [Clostridium sporogenes]